MWDTKSDSTAFITTNTTDTTAESLQIPSSTVDNLLQNENLNHLTLAKMDIEGAEILALKGATSNCCKIDYGYYLYHYNADTNQLQSITLEHQQSHNVFAIANSALDFVRERLSESPLSTPAPSSAGYN
ncbi:MAG: FkbM family methyltransferase [Rivularia sp. (in: cyanobacteria)]|mgnify:FL=1